MKICAAIPTYNHADRLDGIIDRLPDGLDALVIDDGSNPPIATRSPRATLVRFGRNRGKAEALKAAFEEAAKRGFTHVITLDADGQHPPELAEKFAKSAEKNPESIIAGVRGFDCSAIPPARKFMNKFSNFWFRAETGISVADTQCGYRCYPLAQIARLKMDFGGFVFETELLVKAAWAGVEIVQLPIPALYDSESLEGSHYKPFADTLKFTAMNTKLFFASLLLPKKTLRKLALKK